MLPGRPPDAPLDPSDRLNGWKEIASFLGKGVRTVQRWEKEIGLPVHRLGRDGGEIIFAFKSEIQQWTIKSEGARQGEGTPGHREDGETSPGATHRNGMTGPGATANGTSDATPGYRPDGVTNPGAASGMNHGARFMRVRRVALVTLGLVVGTGLVVAWRAVNGSGFREASAATPPQPASWLVEDNRLKVFDDSRHLLWDHLFPDGLDETKYATAWLREERGAVEDLDGDGRREVAFLAAAGVAHAPALHVFNADGTLRFVHRPAPAVHFGKTEYAGWWAHKLFTTDTNGHPSLWLVSIHDRWFPSLVQQLGPDGHVRSEYWSNGYIEYVGTGVWRGSPVVLVGATNNEHRGASLAIFRGTSAQGFAPAVNPEYRCTDCPAGSPLAFVVFPRTCIGRIRNGQATVRKAWITADDQVVALVSHGNTTVNGVDQHAEAFYTLRPDLTPERVELTREFDLVHKALESAGQLDHPFGPADEKNFFPLLRWDGDHFTPLPVAPVGR